METQDLEKSAVTLKIFDWDNHGRKTSSVLKRNPGLSSGNISAVSRHLVFQVCNARNSVQDPITETPSTKGTKSIRTLMDETVVLKNEFENPDIARVYAIFANFSLSGFRLQQRKALNDI